jgi:hypothetical protein
METIEEAAENYAVQYLIEDEQEIDSVNRKQSFKEGAKWQAERMYSEHEVIEIVKKSRATGLTAEYLILTEQFKKQKQTIK